MGRILQSRAEAGNSQSGSALFDFGVHARIRKRGCKRSEGHAPNLFVRRDTLWAKISSGPAPSYSLRSCRSQLAGRHGDVRRLDAVDGFGKAGEVLLEIELAKKNFTEEFGGLASEAGKERLGDLVRRADVHEAAVTRRQQFGDGAPARGENRQAKRHGLDEIHGLIFILVIGGETEEIHVPQGLQFLRAAHETQIMNAAFAFRR